MNGAESLFDTWRSARDIGHENDHMGLPSNSLYMSKSYVAKHGVPPLL